MIEIKMDNVYSDIYGLDKLNKDILYLINKELSYEVCGFGQDKKRYYLLKDNQTYTGLIPRLIKILNHNNIKFKIKDVREIHLPNANFKISEEFEARDYQKNIIERASSREVIQAATGGGKTFIMASLIEKFNVKPVIVIAPKVSLALQIKNEFEKFLNIPIGIIGGGYNDIKDITICTPQSVKQDVLESAKAILWDECLKYDQKVLMANGAYKKIGDLVKEKSTEEVMSYNHKTNKLEPKKIISHSETPLRNGNKKIMKLTIRKLDGTKEIIECTNNHKIWVESLGKYVKAEDLIKGQKVKTIK